MSMPTWRVPGPVLTRDLERIGRTPSWANFAKSVMLDPGFAAVVLQRLQQNQCRKGRLRFAKLVSRVNYAVTGAEFMLGSEFGPGLVIRHPAGIVVGTGVRVGSDCTLTHGVTIGERDISGAGPHEYPRLGSSVTLGVNSSVLGGISVGDGSVVAAHSLVLKDVADMSVVMGVPARRVRAPSSE